MFLIFPYIFWARPGRQARSACRPDKFKNIKGYRNFLKSQNLYSYKKMSVNCLIREYPRSFLYYCTLLYSRLYTTLIFYQNHGV